MSTDLLTRDSLCHSQGGVLAYVSASRLNLWLRCPLAWKLRYIEGVKTPTTPSLFLGKVTHALGAGVNRPLLGAEDRRVFSLLISHKKPLQGTTTGKSRRATLKPQFVEAPNLLFRQSPSEQHHFVHVACLT